MLGAAATQFFLFAVLSPPCRCRLAGTFSRALPSSAGKIREQGHIQRSYVQYLAYYGKAIPPKGTNAGPM